MTSQEQQDPVSLYCRPVPAIMEQVCGIINGIGIPARVYDGTNMDEVAQRVATALTESGGGPTAIVCFHDSVFANFPRRTTRLTVVVLSSDTRVSPGAPSALAAAWRIEGALDRLVSVEDPDECPVSDIMQVEGEEAIPLKDQGASCAIGISLIVKDY